MKERPILFSAPMVRAILEGRKTQTRRVVRKQFGPDAEPAEVAATSPEGWQITGHSGLWWDDAGACIDDAIRCPYGQPGDRLWVREAFRTEEGYDRIKPSRLPVAGQGETLAVPFWYDAGLSGGPYSKYPEGLRPGKYRPGMFMPRAASRILLEVTGIRVERIADISEADAAAEGLYNDGDVPFNGPWFIDQHDTQGYSMATDCYCALWEQINGAGSWFENPWVWVIEFRQVKGGA